VAKAAAAFLAARKTPASRATVSLLLVSCEAKWLVAKSVMRATHRETIGSYERK
jgi:hypothetical protein